jgi:hypothetical protein
LQQLYNATYGSEADNSGSSLPGLDQSIQYPSTPILETFWSRHEVVPWASGYYEKVIGATCGVMQGNVVSPVIFNMVINCILKAWRPELPKIAAKVETIFYVNDEELIGKSVLALQAAVDQFLAYFMHIGLQMNKAMTKAIVSNPSPIQLGVSSPAFLYWMTGKGRTQDPHGQQKLPERCVLMSFVKPPLFGRRNFTQSLVN